MVETGGRAAQVPKESKPVSALVGTVAQEASEEFTVSVLKIGRTFFEKITAVHAFINQSRVDERSSRHLYDICKIFHSYPGLIHETGLLRDVAQHKKKYFRTAAARYDQAVPGTLNLAIHDQVIQNAFSEDWDKMVDMFPETRPSFKELLASLQTIESAINIFERLNCQPVIYKTRFI